MSTSAEASVDIIISGLHYMLSPSMGSDIYFIIPKQIDCEHFRNFDFAASNTNNDFQFSFLKSS